MKFNLPASPFIPDRNAKRLIVLIPGLFAALFLNLFQPFSIRNPGSDPIYILTLAGYGIQGSMVIFLHEFIIRKYSGVLKKNTISRLFAWYLWIVLIIALGNFLYYNIIQLGYVDKTEYDFTYAQFFRFVYQTLIIVLIPAGGLILYFKYRQVAVLAGNQPYERSGNAGFRLFGENRREYFKGEITDVLYIQSKNNYALIFYLDKEMGISKCMLRASLKNLERQLTGTPLKRCHQSYIVNMNKISRVSGNSRGLRLMLLNHSIEIPVSRTQVYLFR